MVESIKRMTEEEKFVLVLLAGCEMEIVQN